MYHRNDIYGLLTCNLPVTQKILRVNHPTKSHRLSKMLYTNSHTLHHFQGLISTAFSVLKAALLLLASSDTHLLCVYTYYRDIAQTIYYCLCYCIAINNFPGVVKLALDWIHIKIISGEM